MSSPTPTSPYVGLTPFTEAEAQYFFGRDTESTIIAANLAVSRLTLFYGPSGVGKSSVLRAGVLKRLQDKAAESHTYTGNPDAIPVYFNQWQSQPLEGLTRAILATLTPYEIPEGNAATFTDQLEAWTHQYDSQLLIILDQFEEYFLYYPNEAGAGTFFEEFIRAVTHPDLRVNFLVSLRDDALAKLDRFKTYIPFLLNNRLDIQHLDQEQAQVAITEPLVQYERDTGHQVTVEPALVIEILEQVQQGKVGLGLQGTGATKATGNARIEAPYLQLVLTRLWEVEVGGETSAPVMLRHATLVDPDKLGGAATIVRNYLNDTMATFSTEQRALAATFFDRLVTPGGTKIALTAHELTDFAARALRQPEGMIANDVSALLTELTGTRRILRTVSAPEQPTQYEIFHDVLGSAVIEWTERYETVQAAEAEKRVSQAVAKQAEIERKNNQRLRWLLVGIVILSLLALVTATIAATNAATAETARREAEAQSRQTVSLRLAAESENLFADQQYALALLTSVEAAKRPLENSEVIPPEASQQLHSILGNPGGLELFGHSDIITTLAFSPDGTWLATGSGDTTANLWNLKDPTTAPISLAGHSNIIYTLAFSPDGTWLATGSGDTTANLWNLNDLTAAPISLAGHSDYIYTLAFSPDGTWLATGSGDTTAKLWNLNDLTAAPISLEGHFDAITTLAFSPDGTRLATGSTDTTAKLWNLNDLTTDPISFAGHSDYIRTLAFSPDGTWLATGSDDSTANLWNLKDPTTDPISLEGHSDAIRTLAFSPDGTRLATGSNDTTAKLWNLNDLTADPTSLEGHTSAIHTLAFSPDGTRLATGGDDITAKLWNLNNLTADPTSLEGHSSTIYALAFAPDGTRLATGGDDTIANLWNLNDPTAEPTSLEGHSDYIYTLAFSPDGTRLATGSLDTTANLWNLNDLTADPISLEGHSDYIYTLAFSPDGARLATGSADTTANLWNLNDLTANPISLEGHSDAITTLAFSPDGTRLATGSLDSTATVWNLNDLTADSTSLAGHSDTIITLAFSPDGTRLATGSRDSTAKVWNLNELTADPISLEGHSDYINILAFSPDSTWLATGSDDSTANLWNLNDLTAKPISLEGHSDYIYTLAFSPDGTRLATGSTDTTAKVWTLPVDQLIDKACAITGRNMTRDEWRTYFGDEPYRPTCPQWATPPEE